MDKLNKYYYNVLCFTGVSYFINMALSVNMLNNNYHSSSTVSCFLSFTLLVLMKLYNSSIVAYQSVKNDKMMSAYMCEFVSFNVLDNDYVKEKYNGTKNNRLEDITDIEEDEQIKDVNESEPSIKEEEIIPIIENK